MEKPIKLSTVLATTDKLGTYYKANKRDYIKFFKGNQGAFVGVKSTYEPKEGTIDEPNKRKNVLVQTTVAEKLEWFLNNSKDYINSLFAQEKTNASSVAQAELVVNGESWGVFTSLELLRLKTLVEDPELEAMIENIPVRSDSIEWDRTKNEMYTARDVYESPLTKGVNITTVKEEMILKDPNITPDSKTYTPKVTTKSTIVELGDTTVQNFTGAWSQRQRAQVLFNRKVLLVAITKALKECNDVEIIESTLTADKIFGFLFGD